MLRRFDGRRIIFTSIMLVVLVAIVAVAAVMLLPSIKQASLLTQPVDETNGTQAETGSVNPLAKLAEGDELGFVKPKLNGLVKQSATNENVWVSVKPNDRRNYQALTIDVTSERKDKLSELRKSKQADGCDYGSNTVVSDAFKKGMGRAAAAKMKSKHTGVVKCSVTSNMIEASRGVREPFTSEPYGWPEHNMKVNYVNSRGATVHQWLWNRSHLVADMLGGEATSRNSVPGTMIQNVGDGSSGMVKPEREVAQNVRRWRCKVNYKVTPVYNSSSDAIPIATVADAASVCSSWNKSYIIVNAWPGYSINYVTGKAEQNSK